MAETIGGKIRTYLETTAIADLRVRSIVNADGATTSFVDLDKMISAAKMADAYESSDEKDSLYGSIKIAGDV